MDGESILVTGGSGFIGTNLVERFRQRSDRLLNVDVAPPQKRDHLEHWREIDILDKDALLRCVAGFEPDVVVHLAARTDLHGETAADYSANIEGVRNLVDVLKVVGSARRAIYASSRLVFDIHRPPAGTFDYSGTTAYGHSKIRGEQIVRSTAGNKWTIVRPTSIWGPWFRVPYKDFFEAVLAGRYIHPRGYEILKSYGFVGNTVFQIERLIDAPASSTSQRVFWLADYPPIDVLRWAESIRRAAGRGQHVRTAPLFALSVAAKAGDAARICGWKEPPLTSFRLDNLLTDMVYDVRELEAVAGPLPYTVDEGTEMTVDWLRDAKAVA